MTIVFACIACITGVIALIWCMWLGCERGKIYSWIRYNHTCGTADLKALRKRVDELEKIQADRADQNYKLQARLEVLEERNETIDNALIRNGVKR